MKHSSVLKLACAALCVALSASSPSHAADSADNWPDKPVRIIVPFAAGGSTDIVARKVAQRLGQLTNQPFVVENKPGAGGTLGAAYAKSLPADGYSLFLGTVSTQSVAPFLYKTLPYDPLKDFRGLAMIASVPNVVVVNKNLGIHDLKQMIAASRKKPGGLTYGSSGLGSSNHLATEALRATLDIPATHVPYRGSGPALTDTMAGHVDFMLDVALTSMAYVERGDVNAVAVTSRQRLAALPNVPTVAEQGFPEFEAVGWFGLFTPAHTPDARVRKIAEMVRKVVLDKDMVDYFAAQGATASGVTLKEFDDVVAADREQWGKVAQIAKIQPE
ncbi:MULTISPECIES: tripartite tricarboxylate transporter substrate binding protein [unclassified Achromobacter]|uniref:Bug family tripartite tricarboxylate transporter substrate binding protein n=1 Tax=unclassified Achromobacter TaxID=2626865 RepID=UPI000B51D73E|nr:MULTISPECIES: tripartite tricarboxylate transporter substrate binding protein [unclassified Achromobacter]OWT71442.1 ABC transporter substrate-binding protein [Achromobacter sp. HZ34]OWT73099.1 ABC transporter substrate-binding protein [Achromobacter sp. HZ28]